MDIKIENRIEEHIKNYQKRTGCTKSWIAKQLGYKSIQALDKAMKNASLNLEVYYKFANFLNVDIMALYKINFITTDSEKK